MLGYYKQVRCFPICVIDCKSDDKTESIARSLSNSVLLNESKSLSIEEMIAEMTMHAKSKWVLRLDDDELPSKALLRYAQKVTSIDHGDAHGFIRYQCAIRNDGFLMRHIDHCPYSHRQWRLYRADKVKWTSQIHSPGFHLDDIHIINAPDSASMIHLDWALHSYEERAKKIDRYDRVSQGAGSIWRHYYLYEEEDNYRSKFATLQAKEFANVSARIAGRFPANCLSF